MQRPWTLLFFVLCRLCWMCCLAPGLLAVRVEVADAPFRPHGGVKSKTRMCLRCKMTVDLTKQAAIAAKKMADQLEENKEKARRAHLAAKMADAIADKGRALKVKSSSCLKAKTKLLLSAPSLPCPPVTFAWPR